jgi:23S rRNA U2552 (ribose-2'-O)-methylase RlmE/FtsJ
MKTTNSYVQDIKRDFNTILDLGAGPGHFAKLVEKKLASKVIMLDSSGEFMPHRIFLRL